MLSGHRVAAAERDARRRRDAAAAEKDLAQFLIHGERAAEIAAAGIRHAVKIQTGLQFSVFALRAVQREERDIRSAADLDHAGADQPFAAALGADLVKIGLGLPHGVNGVSGVGRKDAAGIIHRRGVSEKKIDQRDLVSARTQRACRARAGADGNIALGAPIRRR